MAHYSDTLFSHPKVGTIYLLPISDLHVMEISPFKIRNDSALTELIESICKFGIITPIEVRPIKSKGYEIISGARRHYAASQCNLHSIPAVIVDLDDDDAIIRLVDSNIQRECILPSERALAYKLRMNALKRKAGRPALQSTENSPKFSANFRSDDTVGELAGISGDTVRNLISLTQLVPELMQMVDDKKIGLTPAYQIASLPPDEQKLLVEAIECEQSTPSLSQAQRMRQLSRLGQLNEDTMLEIMLEQKKPVRSDISLSGDKVRKYFPKHYSPVQIEELIYKILDVWHNQRKQNSKIGK